MNDEAAPFSRSARRWSGDEVEFVRTVGVARITMPGAPGAALGGPGSHVRRLAVAVLRRGRVLDIPRREIVDHG